jgi:hypothetical protein
MYRWYKEAKKCYVYLYDVPAKSWANSDWFTRGWTLQELIAPSHLVFYDSKWTPLGTKEEMKSDIVQITGIRESVLVGFPLLLVPAAEKMSWASGRRTTRTEDVAYCLMGLFDVNMSLLYGEGTKAFRRLQEEIIRNSNSYTIFVWQTTDDSNRYHGALAPSPSCFGQSAKFILNNTEDPAEVSSRGVRMKVHLRNIRGHLYHAIFPRQRDSDGLSPSILVLHIPGEPREVETAWDVIPSGANFVRVKLSSIIYVNLGDWPSDLLESSKAEIFVNHVDNTTPLGPDMEHTQPIFITDAVPMKFLGEGASSTDAWNYFAKPKTGKIIGFLYQCHGQWIIVAVCLSEYGMPGCKTFDLPPPTQKSEAEDFYRECSLDTKIQISTEGNVRAAVWLTPSTPWPILCVSVTFPKKGIGSTK